MSNKEYPAPQPTARRAALFGLIMTIVPAYFATVLCTAMFLNWAFWPPSGFVSYAKKPYIDFFVDTDLLDFLFLNGAIIVYAGPAVCLLISVYILIRQRFIRYADLRFWRIAWRDIVKPGKVVESIIKLSLAAGVVFGATLYLSNFESVMYKSDSVWRTTIEDALTTIFGYVYGAAFSSMSYWAIFVSLSFTVSVLVYSIMTAKRPRDFFRTAGPATISVLISIMVPAGIFFISEYHGFGLRTDSIPGYRDYSEEYILARLSDPPATTYHDTLSGEILPNAAVLEKYLDDPDGLIVLRTWAAFGLTRIYTENMDPNGRILQSYENIKMFPNDPAYVWPVAYIRIASCREEYKEIIDKILKEDVADVRGRYAVTIGSIYAAYGEMEKARYWHNRGKDTIDKDDEFDMRYLNNNPMPDEPPFNKGKLYGGITIDGNPAPDIRVGFKRLGSTNVGKEDHDYIETSMFNMIDGCPTDNDGRFAFDGIIEQEYILFVRLPYRPGYDYKVEGSPGVITINEDNPSVDIGTVKFTRVKARTKEELEAIEKGRQERLAKKRAEKRKIKKKGRKNKKKV